MASYTIEDIEVIRRKSGITYQEAVSLLDYHDGNVARALIDLERNGRILSDEEQLKRAKTEKKTEKASSRKERAGGLFQRLYRKRLKVRKGETTIANISVLFTIAALIFSPHMAIAALIASLILGYKINLDDQDPAFSAEDLETLVRNAADNVKTSVEGLARNFTETVKETRQEEDKAAEPAAAAKDEDRSFYQANPAATSGFTGFTSGPIPTIQVPVKVESTDGDVTMEQESDGHNSATIG